jgi:hypothetical protein
MTSRNWTRSSKEGNVGGAGLTVLAGDEGGWASIDRHRRKKLSLRMTKWEPEIRHSVGSCHHEVCSHRYTVAPCGIFEINW